MADAPMNVADQCADPDSVLHLVRDAIALRRRSPDLLGGEYTPDPVDDGLWLWRRGGTLVALNLSARPREIAVAGSPPKTVALSTHRASEGPVVEGTVHLDAWEGVVVTSRG
jgi:alpha-glucosidase